MRFIVLLLLLLPVFLSAALNREAVKNTLTERGYENVQVAAAGDTLLVALENSRFRSQQKAAADIAATIAQLCGTEQLCRVYFLRLGCPVAMLDLNTHDNNKPGKMTIGKPLPRILQDAPKANPADRKVDITLNVDQKFKFGSYSHPIKSQFNLTPALQTQLLPYTGLSATLEIPLYNEYRKEEAEVRPGSIYLENLWQLPGGVLCRPVAGYFFEDRFDERYEMRFGSRYGGDLELYKHINEWQLGIGAVGAYTGFMLYEHSTWYYSPLDVYTGQLYAVWHTPWNNTRVKVAAGRYLYEDNAVRAQISRNFGPADLGFFGIWGKDSLFGFNLSVPLDFVDWGKRDIIRLRADDSWNWEYKTRWYLHPGVEYDLRKRIDNVVDGFIY